jgi:hypothetical protein
VIVIISLCSFLVAVVVLPIYRKKMHFWLFRELSRCVRQQFSERSPSPIHIVFAMVDHFEPGNGGVDLERQISRVDAWCERYPVLARKHCDADGVFPQHTFFYPPHYDTHDHLHKIVQLCSRGFGEVEMHLHHDRQEPWPDDVSTLRKKIVDCIESFSRYEVFCLPGGQRRYAFIHGDWALANSLKNGEHCGVNDEISVLIETGCYADFTFPISNEAQPKLANTIFYGRSSQDYPKGYNRTGVPVRVGSHQRSGLMFVQGIIGVRWKSRTHIAKPSVEQSNLDVRDRPFKKRIDYWIDKRVHIEGRPDWVFVKVHTHGNREVDFETLLGAACDEMYTYLETKYNDQKLYCLHYASAREMYNIIRAAEDGKAGNPNDYRDYEIPRYTYLPERRLA